MEIVEGKRNNVLYFEESESVNLDKLYSFFVRIAGEKKHIIVDVSFPQKEVLQAMEKEGLKITFVATEHEIQTLFKRHSNAHLLCLGTRSSLLYKIGCAAYFQQHQTWISFHFSSFLHNLSVFQKHIAPDTKTLMMVKASSYGVGETVFPNLLAAFSIDYLGVAYADEGVRLRENGIEQPIFVINSETTSFHDIVENQLEPAFFSMQQLKLFCNFLRKKEILHFPIHIAVETGMNRLGFSMKDIAEVIVFLQSTSEVKLKGVYSHLADADNQNTAYTQTQIEQFVEFQKHFIAANFSNDIIYHLLNSEGVLKFGKKYSFDMVRLGIGIFGYSSTADQHSLRPTISWKTTIAQIKNLKRGETVGYGRTFTAPKDMKIATLRVGYADGFSRLLSNGKGSVFVREHKCKVVGTICMDMTMIDVSGIDCQEGEEVELLGENISMQQFASRLATIPYEVMTSFNRRVKKVYYFDTESDTVE